jgi:hypothetical protein
MSNGLQLPGQQYDENLNIVKEFVQQMDDGPTALALIGEDNIEVTPNDGGSSQTRTWNLGQIQAAMEEIIVAYDELISLDLPDILTGVGISFNTAESSGASNQTAGGASEGSYATLALSIHATAQGSASIQPELSYTIAIPPKDNIVASIRVFFLTAPGNAPLTIADILTQLSSADFFNETVSLVPLWSKSISTVSLLGQQVSLSASADVQQRVEISASNISRTFGTGTGYSYSNGLSNRTTQLPATIHADLSIEASDSASATADAEADLEGGLNFEALNATENIGPATATGSAAGSIPATAQTTIPTSGLYLVKLAVSPFSGFGENMIRATVVDFGQFYGNIGS